MTLYTNLVFAALLIVSTSAFARGQELLIEIDKPFSAGSLSGFVVDRNGSPIADARVELMSAGWKSVLLTRGTNMNGFFRFNSSKPGLYYLRLGARYFQTYKIKVKVKNGIKVRPKFELEVGT